MPDKGYLLELKEVRWFHHPEGTHLSGDIFIVDDEVAVPEWVLPFLQRDADGVRWFCSKSLGALRAGLHNLPPWSGGPAYAGERWRPLRVYLHRDVAQHHGEGCVGRLIDGVRIYGFRTMEVELSLELARATEGRVA